MRQMGASGWCIPADGHARDRYLMTTMYALAMAHQDTTARPLLARSAIWRASRHIVGRGDCWRFASDASSSMVASLLPPTGFAAPSSTCPMKRTGWDALGRLSIFRNGIVAMKIASGGSMTPAATARPMPPY